MRILHLFNWNLKDIMEELEEIKNQGFDAIQINPIQPIREKNSGKWWMSYQPLGFQIGNEYGTKEDLMSLCELADIYDLKIIADAICNHMAEDGCGVLNPADNVDPILRNNPAYWKERKTIYHWDDRFEVTHYCMGLPGLNLDNEDVQRMIIHFLNELIKCGVRGFRFDAAKCIALPIEGCNFWPNVLGSLKEEELFNYGEVIFASNELIDAYSKYLNVLTNTSWAYWNKEKIVAFVENHDSYLEFGYTKMKSGDEINRDYYGLTHEYDHTIYYARPFDDSWKKDIVREANLCNKKSYARVRAC